MAFFQQIRLLLRHKITLRKREPAILFLEVFWPVVVFLTILVLRAYFPAERKETCYYNSKSLPSAGAVNFIQSLICTAENTCINSTTYEEIPQFPRARVHQLLDTLSPLLTDKQVTGTIKDLPQGIRLIATVIDVLSSSDINGLLKNGLPLYGILQSTGIRAVKQFLQDNRIQVQDRFTGPEAFVNSTIDVFKVTQLLMEKGATIPETFCGQNVSKQKDVNNDKLSTIICSLNEEQQAAFLTIIREGLDIMKIARLVSRITHKVGLTDFSVDVENVISMNKIMQTMNFTQLAAIYPNLLELKMSFDTRASTPISYVVKVTRAEILIPAIEKVTTVRVSVEDNFANTTFVPMVYRLVNGLNSLQRLSESGLFDVYYRFRDLLKNADAVRLFLEFHLGVDALGIEATLNSTIDLSGAVAEETADPNLLCDRTHLPQILEIPKSETNEELASMDVVFHSICALSMAKNYSFSKETLNQLATQRIVKNLVKLVEDGILAKATLMKPEIHKAMRALKGAASVMPYVKDFVKNFTDTMDVQEEISKLDLRGSGIDLLGSPQAAVITGKLVCGKPLPMLNNEFKLLKAAIQEPKINKDELRMLKSQFCQNGYKQIMRMQGGPIIWSFFKPLLAGKILYSPKNHLTDEVMSRINGTFTFMSGFMNILQAWAQTVGSLENFYRDPTANTRILSVQQYVVQFLGKDVEGLFDDVDTLKIIERLANSGGILGLIELVGNVAQCFELDRFVGFNSEEALEEAARMYTKSHELIGGVVFLNLDSSDLPEKLPPRVEYKMRFDIDFVPSTKLLKERVWEPGAKDNHEVDLGYLKGFVQMQEMIDRAIMSMHLNSTTASSSMDNLPTIYMQQFPYPCYRDDRFGLYLLCLIPVVATIAWIFLIAFLIREFVLERELHLEEVLRVAGLKSSVAWWTWFILGFSVILFGTASGLSILWSAELLVHSNLLLVFSHLLTFGFSVLMYCYMISSFFKTATIASLSGIIVYLASYLPFMVAITLEYDMTLIHKIFVSFSMSTSFCYGIMYTARYEAQGTGVQLANMWQSPMAGDTMSFAISGLMMLLDGVIYFLIGWYISNVFPPGNNAHSEPWYFFLLPSYWGFFCTKEETESNVPSQFQPGIYGLKKDLTLDKYSIQNGYKSCQRRPGMSLHNLYVTFNKGGKQERTAVSNLSLELKEGQITTLLGRNGAGKTTTINVLTGQIVPTSGSVFIYGHAVPEHFAEARKLLGYCPQYNVLFKNLSVREHLEFFAELKGIMTAEQREEDIIKILQSTGLWHMQDELARNLSGGLQRRLCVALAFVGGSKLIILDEPTSSVDPVARRSIWDLIVNQKQSRTVLLTTHHLDEADILSDQVAIIHRGKLLCTGSPLLLKSKYGCGYQLTVSKQGFDESNDGDSGRASNEPSEEQSDSERLLAFTKCLIPNASLIEDHACEVVLALPPKGPDGTQHDYSTFFRCLDANLHTLGFSNYGLTSTTLEEVFITLSNLEEANISINSPKLALARKLSGSLGVESAQNDFRQQFESSYNAFTAITPPLITGFRLKLMQLRAVFAKRKSHAFRDWKMLFCSLLLPCIFIAFAMGLSLIKPVFAPDPILPLTPTIYGQSTTSFLSIQEPQAFFNRLSNELLDTKSDQLEVNCAEPRKGWKVAKCPIIKGASEQFRVLPEYLKSFDCSKFGDRLVPCDCDFCYENMTGTVTNPQKTTIGYVYDYSNVDTSRFILNTFADFSDKRFGGYSFHKLNDTRRAQHIIKVWFENSGFHAIPSYLNALNNAIMRAKLRESGLQAEDYYITTYSHPFHIRSAQLGDQSLMQRAGDAGIALVILVGFVFIPTSFVFYLVRERTQEEKQLQRIFGVGTVLYWFASILWDMLTVFAAVALAGIIIISFQMPIYTARLNFPAVLSLLLAFSWSMTSIVYLMEKLFSESSIAFMVIYCLALFVGMNTMVMRLLIDVFQLIEVSPAFKTTFESVALIFPPYALLSGLVDLTRNQLFSEIFTLFDQDTYVNPFSTELLGRHYYTLLIEGAILFFVNLLLEFVLFSGVTATKKAPSSSPYVNEDSDVAEERRRVTQSDASRFDVLRVVNVSKIFKSMFGKKIAVDHISFSVPRGECFGLLGVNGAGKTTLFRILTAQMKPTSGEARISNRSIRHILSNSCQSLGYCPQADALDSVLSPREHLAIYARMRGIPSYHIPTLIIDSIRRFQLTTFTDTPVGALSRGTKRKLCLAIAMLGNPELILLDEPTSGMDPVSRRCLWYNIQNAIRERRSVLLTSHSMEECDILCSRLAIMVNGRFCCIGSPQYLKHKFGTGYTITLRLSERDSNWNEAISFLKTCFPNCVLRTHHHNMLEFSLPTNDIPLSSIFNNLQQAQKTLRFQDFSVSQTTLDQVFVSFANQQTNELNHTVSSSTQQSLPIYTNKAFHGSNHSFITYHNNDKSNGHAAAVINDSYETTKF